MSLLVSSQPYDSGVYMLYVGDVER